MVLESLQPGAPVNIRNLVIENPVILKEESTFNPQKEITSSEILRFESEIERLYGNGLAIEGRQYDHLIEDCAAHRVLFPQRQLPMNTDRLFRPSEQETIQCLDLKLIFPEMKFADYPYALRGFIERKRERISYRGSQDNYFILKALAIEALSKSFSVGESGGYDIREELRSIIENQSESIKQAGIPFYINVLANVRIALGDQYRVKILPADWQEMRQALDYYRENGMSRDFFQLAKNMKILAAEEVKITEEGVELIMPKEQPEFKQEAPPLPETRRF